MRAIANDLRSRAGGQFGEFIHGVAQFKSGARFEVKADEENPFRPFAVRDERFQFLKLVSAKIAQVRTE